MINIAKKKLPTPVIAILVYLSYCAMSLYVMRGVMAQFGEHYGFGAWFANDIWAFFIGGLVPFGVYELVSFFIFRTMTVKIGRHNDIASFRYGLNYAVIAANVLLFALKFTFIAAPLYAGLLNTILDPTVTFIFVGLYLWYAFTQDYVSKPLYRAAVTQVMGAFIAVYGLLALVRIMMSVAV